MAMRKHRGHAETPFICAFIFIVPGLFLLLYQLVVSLHLARPRAGWGSIWPDGVAFITYGVWVFITMTRIPKLIDDLSERWRRRGCLLALLLLAAWVGVYILFVSGVSWLAGSFTKGATLAAALLIGSITLVTVLMLIFVIIPSAIDNWKLKRSAKRGEGAQKSEQTPPT